MTDSFRMKLFQAQEVPTNWPSVTCFGLESDFCARCNREDTSSPLQPVYGVNRDGDLETEHRYSVARFCCTRHIDGEVQPAPPPQLREG